MSTITPEALEQSLSQAARDPAHRPGFYRDLMRAQVFTINQGEARPEGQRIAQPGDTIALLSWQREGVATIPMFTSLERLQTFANKPVNYVRMASLDFMNMTRGAALVLNPGSDCGKELTPAEIAAILDGSIFRALGATSLAAGAKVMLGQPARHPDDLTAALTRYLAQKSEVKRAYLAMIHTGRPDEMPHTLIALRGTGKLDDVIGGAGMVLQGVNVPDPPVDFIVLGNNGSLDGYFDSIKPFYTRRKFLGLF